MKEPAKKTEAEPDNAMKITISRNGPYLVTGGVPLIQEEICNDEEGYCRTWKSAKRFPVQEEYALCRCGQSKNKPFCDGSHAKAGFNGTEAAGIHLGKPGEVCHICYTRE